MEKKREIILKNYNQPWQQVELTELKAKSAEWEVPFSVFHSLDAGCGDLLYLLIKKKANKIEQCLFSAQQSCLITVAAANIICSCLKGKSLRFAYELINNCELMLKKEDYDLNDCSSLVVFSDIANFPHRLECLKLVLRGVSETLKS